MADVIVTKKNEVYLDVKAEPSILQEIQDFFTFDVPGAKFSPQYRNRMWDGKIRLLNLWTRELYVGLLPYLKEYCRKCDYTVDDQVEDIGEEVSEKDLKDFVKTLNLHSRNDKIEIKDYQIFAVTEALKTGRTLLLSPTASGKSLMIYTTMRWHLMMGRRSLLIVPTTSLVEQMYGDFGDYSSEDEDWNVNENCVKIYSGKEKVNNAPVVITTWQSIYKQPASWFAGFDVIFGDECHQFKAKSLTSIMHKCVNTKYRVGTTGTLDGTQTHKLVLEGLFGPVTQVTTTRKLMDSKDLADLKIKVLILEYSDEERKAVKKMNDYAKEIDFIVSHPKRNRLIRNLALDCKGNTLVLYRLVEKHGKVLYDMIQEKAADGRKVFFVHGDVDAEAREQVRSITETQNDAIIVASLGTFSTGINIRNLHNIIFASPSKSRISNLQSIGRGLRKSDTKHSAKLYDIGDDLTWKKKSNYTLKHLVERVKIYHEQEFAVKIIKISLK